MFLRLGFNLRAKIRKNKRKAKEICFFFSNFFSQRCNFTFHHSEGLIIRGPSERRLHGKEQKVTDDNQIISLIRDNAEQGFRQLMTAYKEPVYWHIRRLVVNHADAQDATQETFVRIFRSFSQYSGEGTFKGWIFRIATNEALRLLGRNQGKATLSLDETATVTFTMKADDYFDYSDVEAVRLQKAILTLPAKQQLAFNLRYYDDLSYKEISAVIGSTEASAKANYHFAKEKIIKYMNSNDA